MDDSDILARIREMVDAEHELRRKMQENPGEVGDAAAELHNLEESLDQFWDLLRQRRAHREFAQDPNESQARPRQQVEGYLQ
jgi:Mg2+ and Co2+ transporter CorA